MSNEIYKLREDPENWLNLLTLTDAKFIFKQAEKRFNNSLDRATKIFDRFYGLLTIISGVFIALVTYLITNSRSSNLRDTAFVTALIATAYFFVLGIKVYQSIRPVAYELPGTAPGTFFNKVFFKNNQNLDERILQTEGVRILKFYKVELINYQERIIYNEALNEKRWVEFNLCLLYLFFSPLFLGIIFLILDKIIY